MIRQPRLYSFEIRKLIEFFEILILKLLSIYLKSIPNSLIYYIMYKEYPLVIQNFFFKRKLPFFTVNCKSDDLLESHDTLNSKFEWLLASVTVVQHYNEDKNP